MWVQDTHKKYHSAHITLLQLLVKAKRGKTNALLLLDVYIAKRKHRSHKQEEAPFYATPMHPHPFLIHFLLWNRPRLCKWDICRKQVTHSGMCVALHRPLQLWGVKPQLRPAAGCWSRQVACRHLIAAIGTCIFKWLCYRQSLVTQTVNQSLFLLHLGLWQMWGWSICFFIIVLTVT